MISKILNACIAVLCGFVFPFSVSATHKTQLSSAYHLIWQYGKGIATDIGWNPVTEDLVVGTSHGIWLIDPTSPQSPTQIGQHPSYVELLQVSPDGMFIASSSFDRVQIRDVGTHEITTTLNQFSTWSMAWHPNRPILATGTEDNGNPAVALWDTRNGQPINVLNGYSDRVVALSWHPDSKLLAVGLRNGQIVIQNVDTAQRIHELNIPSSALKTVAWNPDGTLLAAAGSAQPTFALWHTDTFEPVPMADPPDFIGSLVWSSDGQQLAGVLNGGTAAIWTENTNELTRFTTQTGEFVDTVIWLRGQLASLDRTGRIQIWNAWATEPMMEIVQFVGSIWHVATSPQSNQLAFAYRHSTDIYVIDSETGQLDQILETPSQVAPLSLSDVTWSPQGRWLAVAFDTTLNIWPMQDASAIPTIINREGQSLQLAWNSSDSLAVARSTDTQQEMLLINPEKSRIDSVTVVEGLTAMQWSPNGQQVARYIRTTITDNPSPPYQIQLVDVEEEEITTVIQFPDDMIPTGQFVWLPDSSGLLGIKCSMPVGDCLIWEWRDTGSDKARTLSFELEGINLRFAQISVSPDGAWLAVSDNVEAKIYILNITTGERLLTLDDFVNPIDFVEWIGSRNLVASDGVIWAFQLELPGPTF